MTKSNLSALIDSYGELKAKMADLDAQEKALKEALADVPAGAYEGTIFRLTLTDTVLEKADAVLKAQQDEVVEAFRKTLSSQYLCAHTVKTPSRRHGVKARTGKVEA